MKLCYNCKRAGHSYRNCPEKLITNTTSPSTSATSKQNEICCDFCCKCGYNIDKYFIKNKRYKVLRFLFYNIVNNCNNC